MEDSGTVGPNQQPLPAPSAEVPSSGTSSSKAQLASGFGELKEDLLQNVHPQLGALRIALEKVQAEVENILAEAKKPAERPALHLQQLNDRLTLQEQKQKEQDELIKKLQHQLGDKTNEQDAESVQRSWGEQDTAAMQVAGKERRVNHSGWAFTATESSKSSHGPAHGGTGSHCAVPQGAGLERVHDCLPPETERRWNASVWEASMLVFTHGIGLGASIHVVVLLIVNILVQGSFAMVVLFNFNDATFTDENLEASQMFRLSIGHSVRFQDSLSKSSLMRRVCDGGFSLDMATKPGNLVEDITDYLALDSDPGVQRFFAGELMCTLAVFCWAMVFIAEFERAFSFLWALLTVPVQASTAFVSDGHHLLKLEGVSWQRYLMAALLIAIRVAISVTLLIVGSFWLTYTVNVEDLILNAVALEFVLEVDIMLFALAPSQVKALIFQLHPMPVRKMFAWRGADAQSALLTVFAVAMAVVMFLGYIGPQREKMDEVYDILCNGTLDFVFALDTMGMTYVSPAFQLDIYDDLQAQVARHSVEQVISHPLVLDEVEKSVWIESDFETAMVADLFLEAPSPAQVIGGFDVPQLVDMFNPLCTDELFELAPPMRRNFVAMTGVDMAADDVSCSKLEHLAHSSERIGIIVRNACPNMAGCTAPLTPVPSLESSWGCPSACKTKVEILLTELPCEDTPLDVLLNSSYWSSWVRHIGLQAARMVENSDKLTSHLMTRGCEGLADVETVSLPAFTHPGLCTGQEWGVHPLAHACPVSCLCHTGITQVSIGVCPQTCVTQFLSGAT